MRDMRKLADVLGDVFLELEALAKAEGHDGRADCIAHLAQQVAASHNDALDLADDADRRARRLAAVQTALQGAHADA